MMSVLSSGPPMCVRKGHDTLLAWQEADDGFALIPRVIRSIFLKISVKYTSVYKKNVTRLFKFRLTWTLLVSVYIHPMCTNMQHSFIDEVSSIIL
jgi:hypothetical protein